MDESIRESTQGFSISYLSIIGFGCALLLSLQSGKPVLIYLCSTLFLGSFLALSLQNSRYSTHPHDKLNKPLLILLASSILCVTIIGRSTAVGVPSIYYATVVVAVSLLGAKLVLSPKWYDIGMIVLFATALRSSYYYSSEVIGRDVRRHYEYAKYIGEFGHIIPESIDYYHYYPISHISAGVTQIISNLPPRPSYFIGVGFGCIVGIILMAIVSRKIFRSVGRESMRIGLFSALYLAIAPFHIRWSVILYAQSLTLLFFPLCLWAAFSEGQSKKLIGIIGAICLSLTHNIPAVILTVFLLIFIIGSRIETSILNDRPLKVRHSKVLLSAILVLNFYLWYQIDYLRLQVWRILQIATPESATTPSSSESANLFLTPFLHTSMGLLFLGAIFTSMGLYLVYNYLNEDKQISYSYYLASSIIVAGLGSVLVAAFNTRAIRLVPYIVIVAAPIVGFTLGNISLGRFRNKVLVLLLVLLLPSFVYFSAVTVSHSPGTAPTEERPGLPTSHLSTSQVQTAEFALEYVQPRSITADTYTWRWMEKQNSLETSADPSLHSITLLNSSNTVDCKGYYMYYQSHSQFGINITPDQSVIYDNKYSSIVTCPL
ncbi:hypothetical protein [Haloferax marisrubri]|uniref:hypothetical protein n=1 Tax=Haloferax marisrubri TaxID=1544719 RepID=UPI000AB2EBC3|nr:hypothetical protein [Haloferax marisrubri]